MSLSFGGELLYHGQKGVSAGDPKPYVVTTGYVSFTKSPNHDYAEYYEARLRASSGGSVLATSNLGVPAPDAYGTCMVNLNSFFSGQSSGDYTLSIAVVTPGGTTDSSVSNAFSIPIT